MLCKVILFAKSLFYLFYSLRRFFDRFNDPGKIFFKKNRFLVVVSTQSNLPLSTESKYAKE